jgi:amino acid transporter
MADSLARPLGPDLLPPPAAQAQDSTDSHRLRRTLGLRDLVLMQILLVVGTNWAGIAAREGSAHVVFWLAGILLFFLPVAGVVQYCSRIWPLEGGVYQWTRGALGPFYGFCSAWNFGMWVLLIVSTIGVQTATSLGYALGPSAHWMQQSAPFSVLMNCLIFGFILWINIPGLGIGRWVSHFGTTVNLLLTLVMVVLLVVHPGATAAHPHVAPQPAFAFTIPALTLLSLNLFGKLTFNGLTGLEQVAVFAGETRHPERSILRSAWIAAPLTALIYILLTGSLLTYTPADKIDLVAPLQQELAAAFASDSAAGGLDLGVLLGRGAILALALALVAQFAVIVAEASRLPMVAAWDHLLPGWFTKLHPRYRTPTRSLLVITALAVLLGMLSFVGARAQEAFQVLATTANVCYAINYLLMFAVPLAAGARFGQRPGLLVRLGCLAGAAVTLLSVVLSLVPIVDVTDTTVFALKVGATVVALNLLGAFLYWRAVRKLR